MPEGCDDHAVAVWPDWNDSLMGIAVPAGFTCAAISGPVNWSGCAAIPPIAESSPFDESSPLGDVPGCSAVFGFDPPALSAVDLTVLKPDPEYASTRLCSGMADGVLPLTVWLSSQPTVALESGGPVTAFGNGGWTLRPLWLNWPAPGRILTNSATRGKP